MALLNDTTIKGNLNVLNNTYTNSINVTSNFNLNNDKFNIAYTSGYLNFIDKSGSSDVNCFKINKDGAVFNKLTVDGEFTISPTDLRIKGTFGTTSGSLLFELINDVPYIRNSFINYDFSPESLFYVFEDIENDNLSITNKAIDLTAKHTYKTKRNNFVLSTDATMLGESYMMINQCMGYREWADTANNRKYNIDYYKSSTGILGTLHESVRRAMNSLISYEDRVLDVGTKTHLIPDTRFFIQQTHSDSTESNMVNYESIVSSYWYEYDDYNNHLHFQQAVPAVRDTAVRNVSYHGGFTELMSLPHTNGVQWSIVNNSAMNPQHMQYRESMTVSGDFSQAIVTNPTLTYLIDDSVQFNDEDRALKQERWTSTSNYDIYFLPLNSAIRNLLIDIATTPSNGNLHIFLPYYFEIGESFTIEVKSLPTTGSIILNSTPLYTKADTFKTLYECSYYTPARGNRTNLTVAHLKNTFYDNKGYYYTYIKGFPVKDAKYASNAVIDGVGYSVPIIYPSSVTTANRIVSYPTGTTKFRLTRDTYNSWNIEAL